MPEVNVLGVAPGAGAFFSWRCGIATERARDGHFALSTDASIKTASLGTSGLKIAGNSGDQDSTCQFNFVACGVTRSQLGRADRNSTSRDDMCRPPKRKQHSERHGVLSHSSGEFVLLL